MVKSRDIAKTLMTLAQDGQSPSKIAKSFADFTKRYNREDLVAPVIKALEQLSDDNNSADILTITTAKKASPKIIKKIQVYIKLTDLKPETKVDPNIWGGWQAIYNNQLHDASLANKINHLTKI